jgi:hypothetical protein
MFNHQEHVLDLIPGDATVLDVGGGLEPFPRADAVLDIEPYDAFLAHSRNAEGPVRFGREDWYSGDICHPEVWAQLPDDAFDFAVCSQTLEDVRDPLFVCAQLQRVARAGYIETPSRFRECAKSKETDVIAGWEHHRWIVDVEDGTLYFKHKNPLINHFDYVGESRRQHVFNFCSQFLAIHWVGSFNYAERLQKGSPTETEDLFLYYDRYPWGSVSSPWEPPAFFRIENVQFLGKSACGVHEYTLPIERECSPEEILERHRRRLGLRG